MSFVPRKQNLLEILLRCYILEESTVETYRLLAEVCGDRAPSEEICKIWLRRFKDGYFYASNNECEEVPKNLKMQNS